VEEEIPSGTHNTNLANSSLDSLNCTSGETSDTKYCQDGDRGHQDTGDPPCSEDVKTDSPASHKLLVHDDEDPDPGVAMLYLNNVKQRYLDENHFF